MISNRKISQSLGKCYWCDRALNLGVDIFPATGKPKPQSNVTVPTLESKVFAATDISELVKQVGNEVTVVGEVVDTYYIKNRKISVLNFSSISPSRNENVSFQIVISVEGFKSFAESINRRVKQIKSFKGKYIKVKGVLKLYQRYDITVPQIVVNNHNQISVFD